MGTGLKSFLIAGLFVFVLCSSGIAQQIEGDWQLWNAVSAEKKAGDALKFTLEEETRWGQDINRFIYQAFDAGLIYNQTEWLDLGANFRYLVHDDAGKWEHESRPYLNATLKYDKWPKIRLSNRNRFEYRYMTRTKDTWRYRNMSEIKIFSDWTALKVSPYLREELFFKFDQDNYNQNRLSTGVELRLLKNLNGEVYYLWDTLKSVGRWTGINVIGIKLKSHF